MYQKQPAIYIGYDPKEEIAFQTLVHSIQLTSTNPNINIIILDQTALRACGLYRRAWKYSKVAQLADVWPDQKIDLFDNKPFSTDFSFTRFLIPHLNQYEGLALFMDCDMMVRSDIMEIFTLYDDPVHAISCVWHEHEPKEKIKMNNQLQQNYSKKNWSSFVLWNCSHSAHANLTVDDVNTKSGWWLHNFRWLPKWEEGDNKGFPLIGQIPQDWNWLDGHSSSEIEAKNVHFTTGGPWFDGWKPKTKQDSYYAEEWEALKDKLIISQSVEENVG